MSKKQLRLENNRISFCDTADGSAKARLVEDTLAVGAADECTDQDQDQQRAGDHDSGVWMSGGRVDLLRLALVVQLKCKFAVIYSFYSPVC